MTTGQIVLLVCLIVILSYVVTWALKIGFRILSIAVQVVLGIMVIILVMYAVGIFIEPVNEIMTWFLGSNCYWWMDDTTKELVKFIEKIPALF